MTQISTDHSVRSLLRQGIERLRATNVPSFTLAAELLLLHVTQRNRTWLYAHPDEILSVEIAGNYFALLLRRASGEPTQHLTGKQEFWGLEFEVSPDVLIPRPETEHLIEVALDRLAVREIHASRPTTKFVGENLAILDVGTGSGNIAVTLAKELPAAKIYATDVSRDALGVARRNAARLGFAEHIQFLESNLLEAFPSNSPGANHQSPLLFDLIISNPPYIGRQEAPSLPVEVREHEPETALYGGEKGHELYTRLIPQTEQFLRPNGLLVLELGHDSLAAVQPLLDSSTWHKIAVTSDLAGIPRVLSAQRTI
jgi:release factor glutamine methyltransferase